MSSEVGLDDDKSTEKNVDVMKIELLHAKVAMLEDKLMENAKSFQHLDFAFHLYKENHELNLINKLFNKIKTTPHTSINEFEVSQLLQHIEQQACFLLKWIEEMSLYGKQPDRSVKEKIELLKKISTLDENFKKLPESKFLKIQLLVGTDIVDFVTTLYKRAIIDYSDRTIVIFPPPTTDSIEK